MQKNCGLHKNAGFSQSVRRRNQKNPGRPHNADAGKQKPAAADAKNGLPVLLGGMAVYALEVWLAYRNSAARFEKVDL